MVSALAFLAFFANTGRATELTLPMAEMEQSAQVYFVSPLGKGLGDGSSDVNALPLSELEPSIQDLDHSAKFILQAGIYDLPSTLDLKSASSQNVLVLEGEEGAVIKGNFDFATLGGTASGLRLRSGNVIIRGLDFQNTGFCAKADKYSTVNQVLIENIDANAVHSCILVDRDVQQEISRWIVRDSRINGYYRVGIRLSGRKSHDFLIDNVQIDGAHTQGNSDCYKAGLQFYRGVYNVHVRNTSIQNNIGSCGENYQQGDGIEADHKDGTPRNLRFENVKVANSGDAEVDLKADLVTMTDIVVLGGDFSRYAFKVWSYGNYECHHCYAYGLNKAFINLNEARMKFTYPTFANDKPVHVCDLRHGATEAEQSVVSFENAQIYVGNDEWMDECGVGVLSSVTKLPMGKIVPPSPVQNFRIQ